MAEKDDKIDATRRRLLRVAVYVPPAVLGAVALNQSACQPASPPCAPSGNCGPGGTCGPNSCNPVVNPCNPQNCNPQNCNPGN